MSADQGLIDSVANENTKVGAGAPAFYQSIAMSNAVSHQNRMNIVAEAATATAVNVLLNMDPSQAVSEQKVLSGNDLAQQLSALLTALNSGQQGVKSAQTTPPVTP